MTSSPRNMDSSRKGLRPELLLAMAFIVSPQCRALLPVKGCRQQPRARTLPYIVQSVWHHQVQRHYVELVFDVARSCLYAHRERVRHIDVERVALRSRVHELFVESRSSAGSRSIMDMMREEARPLAATKLVV